MSHDQDRSQKRKAKLEARAKAARAKAAKAANSAAKRQDGGGVVAGSGPNDLYQRSSGPQMAAPSDLLDWPVVRAYAPMPDVWAATGYGTAGIVRQSPTGTFAEAAFTFTARAGLEGAFGKPDCATADKLLLETGLRDQVFPFERSTPLLAAEFIWGAWALARADGASFPGIAEFLRVVPPVPGKEKEWQERLVGPSGLTPRELLELVRALPEAGFTETQEPGVFTKASFRAGKADSIGEVLAANEPSFRLASHKEGQWVFDWTREYPRRHGGSVALIGSREVIGNVKAHDGQLIVESETLSRTAKLMRILRDLLGPSHQLVAVEWVDLNGGDEHSLVLPASPPGQ